MSLTPELWSRAKDLFEDALPLPPEERAHFLEEACPDHDAVRAEVEALLAEHERAGDFLEAAPLPAFGLPLAVTDQPGARVCPQCQLCFDGDVSECPQDGSALLFAFPGSRLIDNKYLVERQLGEGGMGMVYCAYHLGLARRFAIKIMSTSTGASRMFLDRFELEARVLGKLKHPNIVDVTDYGVDSREGGMPYLVMEYLEGYTLDEFCRRGTISPPQGLAILRSIAEAVDYAQSLGILHGDLKPANVFLVDGSKSGIFSRVKILDFGLARLTGWHLDDKSQSQLHDAAAGDSAGKNVAGTMFGTPAYMAPELFSGETTNRASDIYSLGVIAYRLFSGKLPSEASKENGPGESKSAPAPSRVAPANGKGDEHLPKASVLPSEMDEPLLVMLDKDPARRPESAVAAVDAVERAWDAAQRRQWMRREIPQRFVFSILLLPLMIGLAFLLSRVGWIQDLEWKSQDFRFALAPKKAPDPRIVVVSIDEDSLATDPMPLSQRVDEVSSRLEQIFDAGARRVAIDIIPPPSWSNSATFSSVVLRHADSMRMSLLSTPSGSIGAESLAGLTADALGPQRYSSIFAFVNLPKDADGRIRRAMLAYRDRHGEMRDAFATSAVRELNGSLPSGNAGDETFPIDYSIDWRRIPRIAWKDLSSEVEKKSALFRGKVVLVGAEYEGSGDEHFSIPGDKTSVSGLVLQALIANTVIEGRPVTQMGSSYAFLSAGICCGVLFLGAVCLPTRFWAIGLSVGFGIAYICMVWLLFRWTQMLVPVVVPLGVIALGPVFGIVARHKLPAFPH